MYIKHGKSFYLKGIVSASITDINGNCDVTNLALYTNVLKFKDWIENSTNVEDESCGVMSGSTSLIQGGTSAASELFPWTVAVYNIKVAPGKQHHLNTGTLISNRHVIVSALFVTFADFSITDADHFRMFFGAFDLNNKTHDDVISSGVSKIFRQENFEHGPPRQADVALMIADQVAIFSNHIRPVCLWSYSENDDGSDGAATRLGYAVGWGFDENRSNSKKKKYIQMKADSKFSCESIYKSELSGVASKKYFCATAVGNGTPCWADGPLYMKSGDKWFLRGLHSMHRYWPNNNTCAVGYPILYENLSFYASWIETKMSST